MGTILPVSMIPHLISARRIAGGFPHGSAAAGGELKVHLLKTKLSPLAGSFFPQQRVLLQAQGAAKVRRAAANERVIIYDKRRAVLQAARARH